MEVNGEGVDHVEGSVVPGLVACERRARGYHRACRVRESSPTVVSLSQCARSSGGATLDARLSSPADVMGPSAETLALVCLVHLHNIGGELMQSSGIWCRNVN
jgi:hypothetical protein